MTQFHTNVFDTAEHISKIDQLCKLYRYNVNEKHGIEISLLQKIFRISSSLESNCLSQSLQYLKSTNDKNIRMNEGSYGGVQKFIRY